MHRTRPDHRRRDDSVRAARLLRCTAELAWLVVDAGDVAAAPASACGRPRVRPGRQRRRAPDGWPTSCSRADSEIRAGARATTDDDCRRCSKPISSRRKKSPPSLASMGEKFDLRRVRAGQPYRLDRLLRRTHSRVRVRDRSRSPRHRPAPRMTADRPLFASRAGADSRRPSTRSWSLARLGPTSPSLVQALDAGRRANRAVARACRHLLRRDRLQQRFAAGRQFQIRWSNAAPAAMARSPDTVRCSPPSWSTTAAACRPCASRHPMESPATTMSRADR